jgi:hypothetical protein
MNTEKLKTSLRVKIIILISTALLIVFMFPKGESLESIVSIGTIWIQDDLIAPFSFPIIKNNDLYNRELESAKESVYPIFTRDENLEAFNKDSLRRYSFYIFALIDSAIANNERFENPTFLSNNTFSIFKALRQRGGRSSRQNALVDLLDQIGNHVSTIYYIGLLNLSYNEINKDSIALRKGNIDKVEPKGNYLDYKKSKETLYNLLIKDNIEHNTINAAMEFAMHFISPNIKYSHELTTEEITLLQNKVSRYSGIVNENERIIAKHDRITNEIKQKIDSYKAAKGENMESQELILQGVGKFLHIFSLLLLLSIYIALFRKKIYENNLKLLLFALLILWVAFITFFIHKLELNDSLRFLIFIPTASMLITIIFDSRIGFYTTVIISLIAGALHGNDYSFVVINIVAGALSVYTVRDIKNRTQIFRSFLFILVGYSITILAFGLERFEPWTKILTDASAASINALISPVLTYGLLIFFEKIFYLTTDLTLLELSNFDRKLLRELARKAPGTFNHSLTMGNLAESAAEAISANPLLARVGAYYHDIGKSITPQYFVENQLDEVNFHEKITPLESVKIIVDHVKKGIELAEEHKLPAEIIDFIPMHHGTTIMSFFFEKAKVNYGEDKVIEDDYRYPGPKPRTKETAIVMLADTCESAVRSIEDPDAEKVENLITNLINKRIEDGQLDESPLTFNDINKIKETFTNILLGHHHRRIRYPKQDEMEKSD